MLTTIRREIESYLNNSISKTWEISVASCLDIRKLTSCTYTTFSKKQNYNRCWPTSFGKKRRFMKETKGLKYKKKKVKAVSRLLEAHLHRYWFYRSVFLGTYPLLVSKGFLSHDSLSMQQVNSYVVVVRKHLLKCCPCLANNILKKYPRKKKFFQRVILPYIIINTNVKYEGLICYVSFLFYLWGPVTLNKVLLGEILMSSIRLFTI